MMVAVEIVREIIFVPAQGKVKAIHTGCDSVISDSIYPEPPSALTGPGVIHRLTLVGLGVIIASVTIGAGELVWASRSGAIFGYAMLWCFLYAGVFKTIQVYTATRHITLTGEHPMVGDFGIPVGMGNTLLEIGVHVAASLPECLYMEYSDLEWNRLALEPVRFEGGYAFAPDRPGHGIQLDRDALDRYSEP